MLLALVTRAGGPCYKASVTLQPGELNQAPISGNRVPLPRGSSVFCRCLQLLDTGQVVGYSESCCFDKPPAIPLPQATIGVYP